MCSNFRCCVKNGPSIIFFGIYIVYKYVAIRTVLFSYCVAKGAVQLALVGQSIETNGSISIGPLLKIKII